MAKIEKRLISIILALVVGIVGIGISAIAQEDVTETYTEAITVWDGETYTKPQGSGTESDPYLVSAPAELAWMVNSGGGGSYFRLTNDIYINDVTKENWTETAKPWFPLGSTWFAYKNKDGAKKPFRVTLTVQDTQYTVFTDLEGGLWLSLHSPNHPNEKTEERTLLISLSEENGTLK